MVSGTLYAPANSFRTYRILVAAKYGNSNVKLLTSFSGDEFSKKFPFPSTVGFEDGKLSLISTDAIASYVGGKTITGTDEAQRADIQCWCSLSDNQFLPAVLAWVLPSLSVAQYNKQQVESAKGELLRLLHIFNDGLLFRTYLNGEQVTLADITMACNLLLAYQHVLDAPLRKQFQNVTRWFETIVNQPNFLEVVGQVNLCDKPAEHDVMSYLASDKKYKDMMSATSGAAAGGIGKSVVAGNVPLIADLNLTPPKGTYEQRVCVYPKSMMKIHQPVNPPPQNNIVVNENKLPSPLSSPRGGDVAMATVNENDDNPAATAAGGDKKKKKDKKGKKQDKKQQQQNQPDAATPPQQQQGGGGGEGGDAKKLSKEKEQQPAAEDEEMDETERALAEEPKKKDPFEAFPKGTLNMDEWKRVYSNQDTLQVAIPWFWEHFDPENYSIWQCSYKFPNELTKAFMSCNLITGMFQRLDKMRKHSFGSMVLFGKDNDSQIAGIWIWRGHQLAFELSDDLQVDYESYEWVKLEFNDAKTKKLVHEFWAWEGVAPGQPFEWNKKPFNQGKIFK